MQIQQPTIPPQKHARQAFSLVELMIVIVIIGILMSILLPAISNTRRAAQVAAAVADISSIEKAIADFELKFGVTPPSQFVIDEDGSYDGSAAERESKAFLRQVWPQYDFTTPHDMNGNGTTNDNITLSGAECLVYFLYGFNPTVEPGFSANPSNPFATGGSRIGPFLELDLARFTDTNSNGLEELLDPLPSQTQPYEYFSSNNGRGYSVAHSHAGRMSAVYYEIDTNWPDNVGGVTTAAGTHPAAPRASIAPSTPQNGKSFQVISPGFDGEFGYGGLFTDNSVAVWNDTSDPDTTRDRAARSAESDNITNFSGGELGDLKPFVWDR